MACDTDSFMDLFTPSLFLLLFCCYVVVVGRSAVDESCYNTMISFVAKLPVGSVLLCLILKQVSSRQEIVMLLHLSVSHLLYIQYHTIGTIVTVQ